MTIETIANASPAAPKALAVRFDTRYLAPALITCVLVAGQISFGFLESWSRTFLAIATAIGVELVARAARSTASGRTWPAPTSRGSASASWSARRRSGPYALCAAISITSKYVLRVDGRHIWNPTNFGIVAMLVLASDTVAGLSVQWGNNLLPMVVVWVFGAVILRMVGRLHITLTYVVSFLLFAVVRAAITGHPFLSEVAPITGPMYQLFIFFMITDPKTTVGPKWAQSLVAVLIAARRGDLPPDAVRLRAVLRAVSGRADCQPDRDCPHEPESLRGRPAPRPSGMMRGAPRAPVGLRRPA